MCSVRAHTHAYQHAHTHMAHFAPTSQYFSVGIKMTQIRQSTFTQRRRIVSVCICWVRYSIQVCGINATARGCTVALAGRSVSSRTVHSVSHMRRGAVEMAPVHAALRTNNEFLYCSVRQCQMLKHLLLFLV